MKEIGRNVHKRTGRQTKYLRTQTAPEPKLTIAELGQTMGHDLNASQTTHCKAMTLNTCHT